MTHTKNGNDIQENGNCGNDQKVLGIMKINIISDIHASFDAKTNKVAYNNIDTKPEYKFEDAIRCLYEYWKANRSTLIDIDYSYKNLNKYERKANTELLKSYDDCVNFLGNLIVHYGQWLQIIDIGKRQFICRQFAQHQEDNVMQWLDKSQQA